MADVKRKWPWQIKHIDTSSTAEYDALDSRVAEERPAPSRWRTETDGEDAYRSPESDLSPFGFAEDDATLRQVESGVFNQKSRLRVGGTRRQFQPVTSRTSPAQKITRTGNRASATFVWQLFCALVLVGAGYMVEHDPSIPATITTQTQDVFNTDYTSQVQPSVDAAFADMHLAIPTFGAVGNELHPPITGSIIADYGVNHPEIWLSGNPNETVMSAGSGTVLDVLKAGSTYLVKIDNGSFGTSIYTGLQRVSVQANEYVNAGESIGRLPTTPSHPVLRFSLVKNGSYENPHDFIHFPVTTP